MTDADGGSQHCITCSDEGVPMRVLTANGDGLARCVDGTGAEADVMTDLVGRVASGETLLVHAGVALTRITDSPDESR